MQFWFPETGPTRRELYIKHMEFLALGATCKERCMLAGNRVGKTELGAFEVACHLTGRYPTWWEGKRFRDHVNVIASGETGKLVRDSIQMKLIGPMNDLGTGMIPKECITDMRKKAGIPDAIDTVYVRHADGYDSILQFQSYDQGREAFQSTERHVVWFDEEPPLAIYSEGLIRTMTTNGIVMSTFTPLKGVSETVLSLQKKEEEGAIGVVRATWDDAPHLSAEDKEKMLASLPVHQRDARSKGVPALGSGAVYQVLEDDIRCEPFILPRHWVQLYGMDVGWNNTAACWGAYDRDKDTIYVTAVYKRGQSEPAVHASAIKARGPWIPGVIDPASRGRAQHDGEQLVRLYMQQGLKLTFADNTVEAGVFDVYERLSTGRLKVFSSCVDFFDEYRLYRRDDKGKIVKTHDHIMDACRYMVRSIGARGEVQKDSAADPGLFKIKKMPWGFMGA